MTKSGSNTNKGYYTLIDLNWYSHLGYYYNHNISPFVPSCLLQMSLVFHNVLKFSKWILYSFHEIRLLIVLSVSGNISYYLKYTSVYWIKRSVRNFEKLTQYGRSWRRLPISFDLLNNEYWYSDCEWNPRARNYRLNSQARSYRLNSQAMYYRLSGNRQSTEWY